MLAERFARVTVVDQDELPTGGPAFRPGVPQSRHVHVLWSRGVEVIEELLPGITDKPLAGGAALLESPKDFLWLSPADWFRPLPGARILLGSRELLDWTVRGEVLRDRRIRVRDGCPATGLLGGPDGRSVTGVQLRDADPLRAAFVVDATGRTSNAPAWLAALGHPAPQTTRYDSHLGFARSLRSPVMYDALHGAAPLSSPIGFRGTANERRHYERLTRGPGRLRRAYPAHHGPPESGAAA
ncbi:hypothetical protein ACFWP3_32615 [Streptomyces sp. NPDC058525]|uniref:hypothetical protein n=1 Tax=Streptomyces sp. NPDC058525 TaxID=3346538 RepID=UPI003659156C